MPFPNQVATPTIGNKWCRNPGFAWTGERRPERQDQPGGEDAPGPTRRMEVLVKVVSQLDKQWGIDCKPKDFTLAIARLLRIGVIDQPVDILHPEVWDKRTKALTEETMSSGCGRSLESWGRVARALRRAMRERESWRAAESRLLATPGLGVGAATRTLHPSDDDDYMSSQSNPDPSTEGQKRAKSFWGGLIEEARAAAEKSEPEEIWARPPPYAPQDGAEPGEGGRGEDALGGNIEEVLDKGGGSDREGEGSVSEGWKANQSGRLKKSRCGANIPLGRGRDEPRGRERPARKGGGRGRSLTKRYEKPEVAAQSGSDSGSDTSWDEWFAIDLNSEEEGTNTNRVKSRNIPIQIKEKP